MSDTTSLIEDAQGDPYVPVTGKRSYDVRGHIKALGGKWDPDKKQWKVPSRFAIEAARLCKVGVSSLPDVETYRAQIQAGGAARGSAQLSPDVQVCWSCGVPFSRHQKGARWDLYTCSTCTGA